MANIVLSPSSPFTELHHFSFHLFPTIMDSKEAELSLPFPFRSPTRWWSEETVAVVTGANKGIGFAMVKRLAEMGLTVILTARDEERGSTAVEALRSQFGLFVHFFTLDVSDPSSILTFVSWFQHNFGVLDILVNNAAVSFNDIGENSVEHAKTVIKTNYYGAKFLTDSLLPFFRCSSSTSRVLNITSRLGSLDLLLEEVDGVVELFLKNVKNGTWGTRGWLELWTDYAVSKLALNAYTIVLAKRFEGRGLSVNSFCPGFTQTSMTRGQGSHSVDAAAHLRASLALLPPQDLPTGKLFLWTSNDNYSNASSSGLTLYSKL